MINPARWIQHAADLQAVADDEQKPIKLRILALTDLFFHYGQDRHMASRAIRQLQNLVAAHDIKS